MKIRKIAQSLVVISGAFLSGNSVADTIDVTYDIGPSPAGLGGYSASWLHSADDCEGVGPDSGATLYMCNAPGGDLIAITGTIEGVFDTVSGILSITGGMLTDGTESWDILGGQLGGEFAASGILNWVIEIADLGVFDFEDLGMAPNRISADELILWGQNHAAYWCPPDDEQCLRNFETEFDLEPDSLSRWGIDLYGTRASVPEPGTLALLGFGLLALGVTRRRRPILA